MLQHTPTEIRTIAKPFPTIYHSIDIFNLDELLAQFCPEGLEMQI
jgi:hypothetical protein